MKQRTNVYAVCDCSGSMAGAPEETMRQLLRENIKVLADAGAATAHEYRVVLVPFAGSARPTGRMLADDSAVDGAIRGVNTGYPFGGQTALRDAIGEACRLAEEESDPSLVMVFTDGGENASIIHSGARIKAQIERLEKTGNFTFTLAGPPEAASYLRSIGLLLDNFRPWDGSEKELRRVSADTKTAVTGYTRTRSTGGTSTKRFYADASALTPSGVKAFTKAVVPNDIRTVTARMAGRTIADYFGKDFKQGTHFYELVKAEYIQDDKELIVLIKAQNEYRVGARAVRQLLGLPETGKIRVHPSTNVSPYVIYVRSDSVNRKTVEGQTFLTVEA